MIRIENIDLHPYDTTGYRIVIGKISSPATKKVSLVLTHILPSTSLLRWDAFNAKHKFSEFQSQYIKELNSNSYTAHFIKQVSSYANNLIILYQNKRQIKIAKVLVHYLTLMLGIPPVIKQSTITQLLNLLYNTKLSHTYILSPECKILRTNTKLMHHLHLSVSKNHILFRGKKINNQKLRSILIRYKKKAK